MAQTIICVATPLYAPQIGGPATHVALLEQGLAQHDFELHVVKFGRVGALPKVLRHAVYFLHVLWAARGCSFIYALDPVSVGLPALVAAKILGKKLVVRVGGDYAWEQGTQRFEVTETLDEFVQHKQPSNTVRLFQAVQSYVARRAVVVIAPSTYLAGIVRTWGVPQTRIKVIYSQPEVHSTRMTKSDARKKLGLKEDEEIVFSAGRLVPWKGFQGLVDAVSELCQVRRVRLVVAGSGPEQEALETYIAQKSASAYVSLLGQLSQDDLHTWLVAADIFALNTKYEGLSHMLLEAFAARTPVVTTPVGGNVELVEDGKTGLLVLPNDTEALASAFAHLLTDRKFAQVLSEQAYASLSRFNPEVALQKLSSLFKTV